MSSSNRLLIPFERDVHSQSGEDGVLEEALRVIGSPTRWCCEFGAWDGRYLSNVLHLIERHDYRAVMIEADGQKFGELTANHRGNDRVEPLHAMVGWSGENRLDRLLERTAIPPAFDLLSIDIDGNDYHVWAALERYRPSLVAIEFNPSMPSGVDFVQEPDPAVQHGSSIRALVRLGREKRYQLIAATHCNAIFVVDELFEKFDITDNRIETLRRDESAVTHLFSGYDGTVFIRGAGRTPWIDLPYVESRFQFLPRFLRKFPMERWRQLASTPFRWWVKTLAGELPRGRRR